MHLAKITTAFIAVLVLVGFSALAIDSGVGAKNIDFNVPKLQSTESKLKNVNIQYEKLNSQLDKQSSSDKQKIEELNKQKQQLEKQREDLQKQVQAKADEKQQLQLAAANATNTLTATQTVSAESLPAPLIGGVVAGCGDNPYANYIYMHESGCRTHNPNSSGCDGIGQACPSSKVTDQCGHDYDCQNAWFTNYANKYGGWAGAYQFWLNNHWW